MRCCRMYGAEIRGARVQAGAELRAHGGIAAYDHEFEGGKLGVEEELTLSL